MAEARTIPAFRYIPALGRYFWSRSKIHKAEQLCEIRPFFFASSANAFGTHRTNLVIFYPLFRYSEDAVRGVAAAPDVVSRVCVGFSSRRTWIHRSIISGVPLRLSYQVMQRSVAITLHTGLCGGIHNKIPSNRTVFPYGICITRIVDVFWCFVKKKSNYSA